MVSPSLVPAAPLEGYHADLDGTTITEVADQALVAIAVPLAGDARFAEALEAAYGVTRPGTGQSVLAEDGVSRLMGMQPDQLLVLFAQADDPAPATTVGALLGDSAYVTDQSDAWAMVRLSGPNARPALERLCMLDLDDTAFPECRVARTVMDHLAVIILRDGPGRFLLMSPRSSAPSFLHAVETSVRNVI